MERKNRHTEIEDILLEVIDSNAKCFKMNIKEACKSMVETIYDDDKYSDKDTYFLFVLVCDVYKKFSLYREEWNGLIVATYDKALDNKKFAEIMKEDLNNIETLKSFSDGIVTKIKDSSFDLDNYINKEIDIKYKEYLKNKRLWKRWSDLHLLDGLNGELKGEVHDLFKPIAKTNKI